MMSDTAPSSIADLPADTVLTEEGLQVEDARGTILIIACGALAREILALIRLNGWNHMTLVCLPAKLHLYPEQITEAVEEAVAKHRTRFDSIFVAYADCGTGGLLKAKCDELGIEMIAGPHCYSFFEGNDAFGQHEDEITAFYLTDFLVKQFDAFVWRPMGLDRHPQLRDMIFGNYTKLVYQAQTEDPALYAKAEDCARRLGLAFEYRHTGYGDLASALANAAKE
ncbi:Protein of unknown function [Roseovarius nanhaiticus]|uniref:DUF1638 domain-containing protein n=1 Tax=Roseovarius nanhaiticus TaxID=573024 RepID=A0A1N7HEZ9_9RHOB|nr:DUF1638 domain-containing protein [Roseovarius nanhaiticus]SEK98682.1 Protein of unknown function [Roseovarius nanhaiticus]SIS23454.1 Protein of unknown function [Roseovarius nanhaiticus]